MLLRNAKTGNTYQIEAIFVSEPMKGRLRALGLIQGVKIKVEYRYKNGSVILNVLGSSLALGSQLTQNIRISLAYSKAARKKIKKI